MCKVRRVLWGSRESNIIRTMCNLIIKKGSDDYTCNRGPCCPLLFVLVITLLCFRIAFFVTCAVKARAVCKSYAIYLANPPITFHKNLRNPFNGGKHQI